MSICARRSFLRGSAAAAASLPFLGVLPAGAAGAYPKRLIIVTTANGTVMDEYWPGETGPYRRILEPLAPYRDRLLVLRGLDMKSAYKSPVPADHGPDFLNLLTGRQAYGPKQAWMPSGISVDQHIAAALALRPTGKTKFPSLQLGVQVARYAPYMCARGDAQPLPAQDKPAAVFSSVFAGVRPGAGGVALDPAALRRTLERRKSVLDALIAETRALGCQLGPDEGRKLEQHLDAFRELERRVTATATAPAATGCGPVPPEAVTGFDKLVPVMMDMTAMIAACDLSRVITLQLANGGGGGVVYGFAHKEITKDHHTIAHGIPNLFGGTPQQQREFTIAIETWHAGRFKAFLDRLASIREGDGTLLDHSIVVWAHEQAVGAGHSRRDMPWVIAAGPYFGIRPGRAVSFAGKAHSALLKELADRMDVPTPRFGDPDFEGESLSLA